MKKTLITAAAIAGFLAGPAVAADLGRPVRPAYVPRAVVPPVAFYNWNGCYVGGNGGGIWAHTRFEDPFGRFGDFGSPTVSGGLGGFQAGCNLQTGSWVVGIQGDWDWTNARDSNINAVFPLVTHESHLKSLASITTRGGYAWDRYLLYVKGGGAWLEHDLDITFRNVGLGTVSNTRRGWTIGVGAEYALTDWLTGFVEWDYYNFRRNTDNFACVGCGFNSFDVRTDVNVVKAGLNLKFGPTRWGFY
jgi:outer membrane immunogenic protein